MRWTPILVVMIVAGLSGCLSGGENPAGATAADEDQQPEATAEVQLLEWDGHIVHSALDSAAHFKDPETVLYPVQQAGFIVVLQEAPQAIEVMISWEDPEAGFRLHPHYTAENDPELGGDTLYYGYLSDMFDESPGCIRIPSEDMAAGKWPMMMHPRSGTMDADYTITVAIQGAEGTILDDMHGHRSDGDSPVVDHGVEACQLLGAA